MSLDDLRAQAHQLAAALDAYHEPVPWPTAWYSASVVCDCSPAPPPGPPPVEGQVWSLPTQPTTGILGQAATMAEIRSRIAGDPGLGWPVGYVDPSEGLEFTATGFRMHYDPAKRLTNPNTGGANWVNSACPLAYPGTHVRLGYTVELPADLGKSLKFPGLERMQGTQQAPGGGFCGPGDMIVRPALSDWNQDGQAWFGLYSYWPHPADKGAEDVAVSSGPAVELWHPAYANQGFSLWWYATPTVFGPGQTIRVELEIERTPTNWFATLTLDDSDWVSYRYPIGSLSPSTISHHAFVTMYGGDSAAYGPAGPTTATVTDYTITTLN